MAMLSFSAYATGDIVVSSEIEEVTVYRQRAQITRTAEATVQPGENTLIFRGLSQYLMANSINVRGQGPGVIQSVRHRVSYLNRTATPARVMAIEDSLELLQMELDEIADERFVNESEEKLLLSNQNLSSEQSGLSVETLREVSAIYRERLSEVRKNLRFLKMRERKLKRQQGQFQQEIMVIKAGRNQPTQEVVVIFKADKSASLSLELVYLVNNANWNPFYDVRVANTADPIQLALKANVVNNTGIDWEDIRVKLSTTQNSGNNNAPALGTHFVAIGRAQEAVLVGYGYSSGNRRQKRADSRAASNTADVFMNDEEDGFGADEAGSAADFTQTTEGELGLEFDIALRYEIPADGKEHQVDILQTDVKADYQHYAVPKLDPDAFLVAEISQDLLRGPANVYFEGTFVGETYINTDNPRDSMRISLGRDPKVQVQREQLACFVAKQSIGGKSRKTYSYETTIKNNKATPVTLTIQDQIPISTNKEIEVSPGELSGGTLDEATGMVTWVLTLQPGEKRMLPFGYEVKYPKNQSIRGL